MKSKLTTVIASAVVLSLLLLGTSPIVALPGQQTSSTQSASSTTSSTTSTHSTSSQSNPAQTARAQALIQLAQAAQSYVQQVLSIAQSDKVNVTSAEAEITLGNQLLSAAQSVIGTNATQAAQDALGAMKDYKTAAETLQNEIVVSVTIPSQVQNLSNDIARLQNRTSQYQTAVNKLCSEANASASTCSDANTNLASASTDLSQALTQLNSITSSSTESQIKAVDTLVQDASSALQKVATDINTLASAFQDEQGIEFVQTVLQPRLTQIEQLAQNAKLNSTQLQTINGQLSQAQTLLNSAVKSFQSGDFKTGTQDSTQATALMALVLQEIAHDIK